MKVNKLILGLLTLMLGSTLNNAVSAMDNRNCPLVIKTPDVKEMAASGTFHRGQDTYHITFGKSELNKLMEHNPKFITLLPTKSQKDANPSSCSYEVHIVLEVMDENRPGLSRSPIIVLTKEEQ